MRCSAPRVQVAPAPRLALPLVRPLRVAAASRMLRLAAPCECTHVERIDGRCSATRRPRLSCQQRTSTAQFVGSKLRWQLGCLQKTVRVPPPIVALHVPQRTRAATPGSRQARQVRWGWRRGCGGRAAGVSEMCGGSAAREWPRTTALKLCRQMARARRHGRATYMQVLAWQRPGFGIQGIKAHSWMAHPCGLRTACGRV